MIAWDDMHIHLLGKACMLMYHLDLFDDEDTNVELAHLALLYTQRAEELFKTGKIENSDILFEILRIQAVLFKTCEDCYIENISNFYRPHNAEASDEIKKGSMMLAQRVMLYVLYSVLIEITDTFESFRGDAFLEDICRNIELENPSITEKLTKEGSNVRKLLYTFSKAKIIKGDFSF